MKKFFSVIAVLAATVVMATSCSEKKSVIKIGYEPWVACEYETDEALKYLNNALGDKYKFEKVAIKTSTEMITTLVENGDVDMFFSEDGTVGSMLSFERGGVADWRVKLETEKLKDVNFKYTGIECCEEFYIRKDLNIHNMEELKDYSDKNGGLNFAITTGYYDRGDNHNSGLYLLEYFGLKAKEVYEMDDSLLSAAVGTKQVDFAVNMEIMPPTHENCVQLKGFYDQFFLPQNCIIIFNKKLPNDVIEAINKIDTIYTQKNLEKAIMDNMNS